MAGGRARVANKAFRKAVQAVKPQKSKAHHQALKAVAVQLTAKTLFSFSSQNKYWFIN